MTSQVAANFPALNFKDGRHIKFAVSSIFFPGQHFSFTGGFLNFFFYVNLKKKKKVGDGSFNQKSIRKSVEEKVKTLKGKPQMKTGGVQSMRRRRRMGGGADGNLWGGERR